MNMDAHLEFFLIVAIGLFLAGILALVTKKRKPKVKKPKCTCSFAIYDNPWCLVHGSPQPATKKGHRFL